MKISFGKKSGGGLFGGGGITGVINNATNAITNTIQTLSNNRTDRNINRDNVQGVVMNNTGLNTQADKYTMFSSLSKDGAATTQGMSKDAKGLVTGLFGGMAFDGDGGSAVLGAQKPAGGGSSGSGNFFLFAIIAAIVTKLMKLW